MKAITFTITEEEVRGYAPKKFTKFDVSRVLDFVECDYILWSKIEDSIKDAISTVEDLEGE
jgi:hypothetical protein